MSGYREKKKSQDILKGKTHKQNPKNPQSEDTEQALDMAEMPALSDQEF